MQVSSYHGQPFSCTSCIISESSTLAQVDVVCGCQRQLASIKLCIFSRLEVSTNVIIERGAADQLRSSWRKYSKQFQNTLQLAKSCRWADINCAVETKSHLCPNVLQPFYLFLGSMLYKSRLDLHINHNHHNSPVHNNTLQQSPYNLRLLLT